MRAKRQAQQLKHAAHMLERMINQNTLGDVAMDMRVQFRASQLGLTETI